MRLLTASHLYAQTIAEGDFRADWELLLDVLGNDDSATPTGLVPSPRADARQLPKRQYRTIGGRRRLDRYVSRLTRRAFNRLIDGLSSALGVGSTAGRTGRAALGPIPSGLLGRLRKRAESSSRSSLGISPAHICDLFKFQIASRSGAGRMGVLVVASDKVDRGFFVSGCGDVSSRFTRLHALHGHRPPTAEPSPGGLDLNDWGLHSERDTRRCGQ